MQDGLAAAHIRPVEGDAPVKATGAQQGRVEDVGAVGGGHNDHIGIGIEAVHLDQHLVEGLLAFIMRAAQAGAALASDRIDLIHKDDAGRMALGLVEQVTHTAGAHADEHFHELGAGDGEEGHAGFAGNCLGQQGFARAGRADQQHALRDARPELDEFLRFLQELDYFLQFILGFVDPGYIFEGDGGMFAAEHARLGFSKGHGSIIAALRLAENEPEQAPEQDHRQDDVAKEIQDACPRAGGS